MNSVNNYFLFIIYYLFMKFGYCQRPNILFIVADDLGWNDVSFHSSLQIPTPNIDALAYDGIILNNYYVSPICTPSRSAIMTGKHPIHTGMQRGVIMGPQPYGLPLNEKILPQFLKKLRYKTYLVGKWHLGFYSKKYTPLFRGFDYHFGYWCGHIDYFDYSASERNYWGFDSRTNMNFNGSLFGQYSTEMFAQDAVRLIQDHNVNNPLFLYFAPNAVHSANGYNPLQVTNYYFKRFPNIYHRKRRKFAGVLSALDDAIGNITEALYQKNMLNNTIIVFTTDNGGPAAGFNLNFASNWPLRGVKNTLWEGGVRGSAFMWSTFLKSRPRVSMEMMHITDWLPTLYHAIGGDVADLGSIDGINLWDEISQHRMSARTEMLHNIDPHKKKAAVRKGNYKLYMGLEYKGQWNGWYKPEGLTDSELLKCNGSEEDISNYLKWWTKSKVVNILKLKPVTLNQLCQAQIKCHLTQSQANFSCKSKPCLFNIEKDPCEYFNIANEEPQIVQELLHLIDKYNETAVPPLNKNDDPNADPKNFKYVWTPWIK